MNATTESIGGRIRIARKKRRLTQADLAARLGIGQSRVAEWEAGRYQPSADSLRRLAVALGVRAGRLIA